MQSITNKLNCKCELWGLTQIENELGEMDIAEGKIKDIYCNILPSSATQKWNNGITEVVEHSHKFIVRSKSITDIKVNMFFVFKGLKYEFISYNFDFKNNKYIEIFTKLVIE